MRVGLDAHMVGGQETGNETYIKGLVDGFRGGPQELELLVYRAGARWLEPDGRLRDERLVSANPYFRLGFELPVRSLAQRLDILHLTYVAPLWSHAPLVLSVHDICYVTNPEWFSARDLETLSSNVPRSIKMASHVITEAHSGKQAMVEHYGVAETKISVISAGPGRAAKPVTRDAARTMLVEMGHAADRPYVLAVGNLQPRKNLVRLIEAFRTAVSHGHDFELVIVGPPHYRASDAFEAAALLGERVHFTGYVSDDQLAAWYECASAFVFPSLYEGFGLPAIEAMAHGVPVACSDAGALPEVCGSAALYFDPLSVDSIVATLERIVSDRDLRETLSKRGRDRAPEFSWTKASQLTYDVYRQVLM